MSHVTHVNESRGKRHKDLKQSQKPYNMNKRPVTVKRDLNQSNETCNSQNETVIHDLQETQRTVTVERDL